MLLSKLEIFVFKLESLYSFDFVSLLHSIVLDYQHVSFLTLDLLKRREKFHFPETILMNTFGASSDLMLRLMTTSFKWFIQLFNSTWTMNDVRICTRRHSIFFYLTKFYNRTTVHRIPFILVSSSRYLYCILIGWWLSSKISIWFLAEGKKFNQKVRSNLIILISKEIGRFFGSVLKYRRWHLVHKYPTVIGKSNISL